MHAGMRACWHHARQPGLRRGVRRGGSDRGVVDVDALGVEFVEGQRHGGVQLWVDGEVDEAGTGRRCPPDRPDAAHVVVRGLVPALLDPWVLVGIAVEPAGVKDAVYMDWPPASTNVFSLQQAPHGVSRGGKCLHGAGKCWQCRGD